MNHLSLLLTAILVTLDSDAGSLYRLELRHLVGAMLRCLAICSCIDAFEF